MCGSCGPDADEPIPLIKHRKERCCTLGVHYGEKVSLASAATLRSANGALPPSTPTVATCHMAPAARNQPARPYPPRAA